MKNRFENDPKIYLHKSINIPKTLEEFVILFFSNVVLGFTTGITTYDEQGYVQCRSGKYRSFDDLFNCCKTYFPVTVELLIEVVIKLRPFGLRPQLAQCGGMRRIRIIYGRWLPEVSMQNSYDSKYSWSELLGLLGIKNNEDFIKYCNDKNNIINIEDKSTFPSLRNVKPIVQKPKTPKTIHGLKLTIEYNKITIGKSVFSRTDIQGMVNRFNDITFNKSTVKLQGTITIDDKKIPIEKIRNLNKII